ncbi:MAG TPA: ATP-dependent RNA helicase HrpA [Steroidobacteraceae bacterium]|nr:ATP-dependent RNA helicase HrpA [Steroidobacteraceae bacterium]
MSTPSRRPQPPAAASAPDLKLEYDPALPISAHRAQILEALARHQVIVVCGATGSGKTTQLPKLCLEAGRGTRGLIGHTQPRRLAARALASRLAQELGTTVGGAVGYKVRFNDRTGPQTRVKLMTDGILLKELESDRRFRRYDTIIVDEAHERSLNIDLLLGVLKQLLPSRPELKVIITSATIDPQKFADFFGGAPIIEVSGRSYPVEVRYRPLIVTEDDDEEAAELSLPEGIVAAIRELDATAPGVRGDTLVFLPGEKQIREAAEALEAAELRNTQVLALYARLSASEQQRIFEGHTERRIVLATNVAETSLTVPGIRYVIDSGLARISRYNARAKVQRLPIEKISQASADQRKGRCGREAEGICIRLYSEEDFSLREAFTPPEVLRTNLASVILRMAAVGLGDPERFPFLDPPDTRLINDGVRLLQELKAMDEERRVTSLGQQIAGLPVDPRLGRMLLAATRHNCLTEMLIIAAFLEAQDPRERPADAQQHATQKHAELADKRSDFVTVLNLWRLYHEQAATLSRNQLRKWCREHFLSAMRMREWQDLHAQLADAVAELKLRPNQVEASYAELHQAILTGFLGSIGNLDERREYDGPRGVRFVIAPGTPLASRPPKWVVAGSLIETTRLYARMVAAVDPGWIEAAGAHLLKRVYTEPHWVDTRGYVSAYETVTLYGLTLASRRRVNYAIVAPAQAHEIFAREALVAGHSDVKGAFLAANRELLREVEKLEAKIRRRDILVDETTLVNFYTARIPERVSTVAAFESWRGKAERAAPRLLYMTLGDVMARETPEITPEQFPDDWPVGANRLPLSYKFEPVERDDGLTLTVPEPLVDLLDAGKLAWLVPGMRLEKVTELMRALPKELRKPLVPVPDSARAALAELPSGAPVEQLPDFYEWLAQWITPRVGQPVTAAQLAELELPVYLRMNVRVVDANDDVIAEGRDVAAIRRELRGRPPSSQWLRLARASGGDGASGSEGASSGERAGHREHTIGGVRTSGGGGTSGAEAGARGAAAGPGGEEASGSNAAPGAGRTSGLGAADGSAARESSGHAGARAAGPSSAAAAHAEHEHRRWDFGDLPESVEVHRRRLRFNVYPAIEDRGTFVTRVEARTAAEAEWLSRAGITRLILLSLPQQVKYISQRIAQNRELVLLSSGLELSQPLPQSLTWRAVRECFLPEETPLPRSEAEFTALVEARRGDLADTADRLTALVQEVLKDWRQLRLSLDRLRAPAFAASVADIEAHLADLLPPDFVRSTPQRWLAQLPRYLRALRRRVERLQDNVARDAQLMTQTAPFATALRALASQSSGPGPRPELEQFRWMLEEYRVSLYAQELKTLVRVSDKRLAEQLERARAEARG